MRTTADEPPRERGLPDVRLKAAALLHSLVGTRALVDGNKRLAWLAVVVFLDLNGRMVDLDDDAVFELVMTATEGHLDVDQIAQRLPPRRPPISTS